MVLPPSARDKRLQQSSNIESLKKGGAGESGFCYEAGAPVEVAPEDALLAAPLDTAASVEPEALPAVMKEHVRGEENEEKERHHRDGRQVARARDESASNRRARKCGGEAARVGAAFEDAEVAGRPGAPRRWRVSSRENAQRRNWPSARRTCVRARVSNRGSAMYTELLDEG